MKPLAEWRRDALELDELAYCARHPYPLLVHVITGYKIRPVERLAMTLDRAVLSAAVRPKAPPSAIDDYLAVAVVERPGWRSHELVVGCYMDTADVWINDVTVSSRHATMMHDRHNNWYVHDASSTTGTHVNDRDPAPTQVLVIGDRISFGMVDFTFHLPASAYALIRRLAAPGGAI